MGRFAPSQGHAGRPSAAPLSARPGTCPSPHPSEAPEAPQRAGRCGPPRGAPRPSSPFQLSPRRQGGRARSDPDTPMPGRAGAQAEGRFAARGVSQLVSEPGRVLALGARCRACVPITRADTRGSAGESGSSPRPPGPVQSEHTPPPTQRTRLAHAGRFPPRTGRRQAPDSRARPHRPAAARTGPPLPPAPARAGARSTFFVCSAGAPPPPSTSPSPRPPRTRPANEARRRRAGPGVLSAPRPPIGRALHPAGARPAGPRGGARGPK